MNDVPFETELAAERASDEPALVVDVEGFEGPLDLLLALARQQKVDLAKISILALADQYLAFIEEARKLRLELAADYLVMAAWLAYLKSRLDLKPEQLSAWNAFEKALFVTCWHFKLTKTLHNWVMPPSTGKRRISRWAF